MDDKQKLIESTKDALRELNLKLQRDGILTGDEVCERLGIHPSGPWRDPLTEYFNSEVEDTENEIQKEEEKMEEFNIAYKEINIEVTTECVSDPVALMFEGEDGKLYRFKLGKKNVKWLVKYLEATKLFI